MNSDAVTIAIIGAGNVGSSVGGAAAQAGHNVLFGARDPNSPKTQAALQSVPGAKALPIAAAVAAADLVLLAAPNTASADAIAAGGDWRGKVLMDATNRFTPGKSASLAEEIAGLAQGARVVKAFNAMGSNVMSDPVFGDQRADLFICGDDAAAKALVTRFSQSIGFETVDCGPLSNAHLLEALAQLWVSLARGGMGRDIAFKLLRR